MSEIKICPEILTDSRKCKIKISRTNVPRGEQYCIRYCKNPDHTEWQDCKWLESEKLRIEQIKKNLEQW